MVALGLAENVAARFGRAHIVDAQVQRCDIAQVVHRRSGRRAAEIVEESGQHAAMDDSRIGIADQALLPGLDAPDMALFHLRHAEAETPPPRDDARDHVEVTPHQFQRIRG